MDRYERRNQMGFAWPEQIFSAISFPARWCLSAFQATFVDAPNSGVILRIGSR